ncbi:MAG: hypothetical protein IPL96_07360 [Holophagaceae bacterium]|nr:hypothetical protein [Holophagaceae bacterium]
MRFAQTLLPASALLLLAACRPLQVAWSPRGPLLLEVQVANLPPDFRAELEGSLREAFEPGAAPAGAADGAPANRLIVRVTELQPDPRSSFWKNWGLSAAGGTLQGGTTGTALGAALGLAFGVIAGPFVYAQHAAVEHRVGYRPFVVQGHVDAGVVLNPGDAPPRVLNLITLDIRDHLPALRAEEAQDPARIRQVTAQALAKAIREALRQRGVI